MVSEIMHSKKAIQQKKTWRIEPPHVTVMRVLEKKGSLTDEQLFQTLKTSCDEMGGDDLRKILMGM